MTILWTALFLSFMLNALLYGSLGDMRRDLKAVRADRDRQRETETNT